MGEIGLDRAREGVDYDAQRAAFAAQLQLSQEHELPVILHIVRAHGHAIEHLEACRPIGGVVHGFSGSPEVARRYVKLGLHISFGALLNHPRAKRAKASVPVVPLDRLLIETDSPEGFPDGSHLHTVLNALAEHRRESIDELAEATARNARNVYREQPAG